ncbi:MAG: nodulation protein NfeD, partial [Solirubrobacterales bacterium]|nr:nodulation protein NfeD [Solirubrobacterales bacterium]
MTARALRLVLFLALLAVGLASLVSGGGAGAQSAGVAYSIELDGAIDPAAEGWIGAALEDAAAEQAELAIIRLDTPGGLIDSTRAIVDEILTAPMPVVVYVSPDGARAASAGLFITEAADVAAMAPQTNIGAATPINLDGTDIGDTVLGRKILNDAAAYARALAEGHARNGELAEAMVTDAVSVASDEALSRGLIDAVAADEETLLAELDGFEVSGPKRTTLETEGLELVERERPFTYDLLSVLVNPTVSFLLLVVGIIGIVIEVFAPGLIVPGALGALSFLAGLFGSLQLPLTALGIGLLVLGVGLLIAEAHITAGGILGIAGVVALALSGLVLYDTGTDAIAVSAPVVVTFAVVAAGLLAFVGRKVLAARRNPVHTGWEELIGAEGEVREGLEPVGQAFVHGALWRAVAADGLEPAEVDALRTRGCRVTVESVDGLTLGVRPG